MKKLTSKQNLVYKILEDFIDKKGYSPTLIELKEILIKNGMKLKSLNGLVQYLNTLEDKSYIERTEGSRNIRIIKKTQKDIVVLPYMGQADCGEANSFADDSIEGYIRISKKFVQGDKKKFFFIKAVGTSMNKEGIEDGNYVLVKKTDNITNGMIVLVVVNGLGTIKKFERREHEIVLLPNSTEKKHLPIFLHPDDQILVCGEVVKVFKL